MLRLTALLMMCLLMAGAATANGGGGMGGGTGAFGGGGETLTPEQKAVRDYNAGVKLVGSADDASAAAAAATDAKRRDKAAGKAADAYRKALAKFESATTLVPAFAEAWNYVGYTRRQLGDAAGALVAYDRALQLKPAFLDAIEYRGVAYLALDRVGDAREAYLQLFGRDAALAAKLLDSMRQWVVARRATPNGADAATVDELARWIDERQRIAATTAGLVPAPTERTWH